MVSTIIACITSYMLGGFVFWYFRNRHRITEKPWAALFLWLPYLLGGVLFALLIGVVMDEDESEESEYYQ